MSILLGIDVILLLLLLITAIAIVQLKDLFATVMLSGIFGLLSASFFVAMDAVDVAFTEAAVGAGVFPLLLLAVLASVGRYENNSRKLKILPLLLAAFTAATLLVAVQQMPPFGSADAPAQQHVAVRYIEDSPAEIGIPNMVTSVLASYRGFDTLGEVLVIFTAAVGVMAILIGVQQQPRANVLRADIEMADHKVLRIVGKMLIPLILIFALYVQFHGEYGPGGGFQAGVIFAAAIILYTMLFGLTNAQQVIPLPLLRLLTALGVLLYGSVGVVSLLAGGNFLDYSALADNPITGQHIGIILIELGVGITVAASMVLIFFSFSLATQSNGELEQ